MNLHATPRSYTLVLVLVASLPLLASCGGTGGDEPLPGFRYPVLAQAGRTGAIVRTASGTFAAASSASVPVGPGDRADNADVRVALDFYIGGFSSSGTVHDATLRFFALNTLGAPYSGLGSLRITAFDMGGALDATDYDSPTLPGSGVRLLTSSFRSGWAEIDVTEMVRAAHGLGINYVSFRLAFDFATDGDGITDAIVIAGVADAERPELAIRFEGLVF